MRLYAPPFPRVGAAVMLRCGSSDAELRLMLSGWSDDVRLILMVPAMGGHLALTCGEPC